MFITPDENVIIMEDLYNPFSVDDLHKLEDAGIKTVYLTHPICLEKVSPAPGRVLDWSSVDDKVEKYFKTSLKVLLPFYYTMPDWFYDDCYIQKHPTLLDHNIPNYANLDYIDTVDGYISDALHHFNAYLDRVQLTYAIPAGGEFLWDSNQVEPFPVHPDEITGFVVGRQTLLARQHGEIWTLFHNFLGDSMNWNNTQLPSLYAQLEKEFPSASRYSIQGAHFSCGYITDKEKQMKVRTYKEKFGVQSFVGSDYCEGMIANFDAAIEQSVRGFLTAPLHHYNSKHPKSIEPWMVDAIRNTNKKFMEAYK